MSQPPTGPQQPYQKGPQQPYGQQPQYGATQVGPPPKKKRTALWIVLGILAGLLVLIIGCSAILASSVSDAIPETTGGAPADPTDDPATEEPATEEPADESTEDEPANSDEAGIKDTYTWEDGVEARITKIEHRKVSEYAAGGRPGEPMVVLTFKVTNNSDQNLDGTFFSADLTYGKDGNPAETVFDSSTVGDGIDGTIGKGRSKSGEYAFAVPTKEQKDVVIEVTPGFEYNSAIFAGSVAK